MSLRSRIFILTTISCALLPGPVSAAEELRIGETKQFQVNGGPGRTLYLSERRLTKDTSEFCEWGHDVLTGQKKEKKCMTAPYEKPK